MDVVRWSAWAQIGGFFVGILGVLLLIYQIQAPWLPVGLIVFGVLVSGALHFAAARVSLSGQRAKAAPSTRADYDPVRPRTVEAHPKTNGALSSGHAKPALAEGPLDNPRQRVSDSTTAASDLARKVPAPSTPKTQGSRGPAQRGSLGDQVSTEKFLSAKVIGVTPRDQHGLELLVTTQEPSPKTGVSITITNLSHYSAESTEKFRQNLSDSARKPMRLKQTRGEKAISVTKPQVFDLLTAGSTSWSLVYQISESETALLPISFGVWRVDLLIEWNGLSRPERLHFEVAKNGRPKFVPDPTRSA